MSEKEALKRQTSASALFIPHNDVGLRQRHFGGIGLMKATLSHVAASRLMPTAAAVWKWEKARTTPAAFGQQQSTCKQTRSR